MSDLTYFTMFKERDCFYDGFSKVGSEGQENFEELLREQAEMSR